ncbi:putative glycerol-3-phosphate acyltransferase [subsurface metagenome]
MAIAFGLLIAGAYLLGSMPAAYLVARWSRGVDLRQFGSGNVGATNLLELTSKRLTIPVIIFDLVKGAIMVWVAQIVGLSIAQQVTVGLATIMGHNWPVFLRFNGGRGVLTTLGVVLMLPIVNSSVPWGGLIALATFAGLYFTIHNIPLGVVVAAAVLPLASWGVGEPIPLTLGYLAIFLILIIRRLLARPQIKAAPTSKRGLILNRLLFDRDIRDREAWLRRAAEQQKEQGEGRR